MACIRKVGVLGQGHVGAHVANSLLVQGLVDELYLCDINAQKLTSETQDFTDALSFYPHNCKIVNCGDEYEKLAGCAWSCLHQGRMAHTIEARRLR